MQIHCIEAEQRIHRDENKSESKISSQKEIKIIFA